MQHRENIPEKTKKPVGHATQRKRTRENKNIPEKTKNIPQKTKKPVGHATQRKHTRENK